MNDGLHLLDIVFFAMVAAFLVLRLRSVLGKRTGNERPPERWRSGAERPVPAPEPPADNVIDLAKARQPSAEPSTDTAVGRGLAAIRDADSSLSTQGFLDGARAAFAMIVGAYAAGDRATLKPLLSPEVYANFTAAIDHRERAGETLQTEMIAIRKADPIEARLEGGVAYVTVRFVSEQVNLLKDAEGRIIEGDPGQVADVVDEWTFRRDTRSRNPNWELAATRTPDDEA